MKYEIPLHRTKVKRVTVFADSPHAALLLAKEDDANKGYFADSVIELGEDPEEPGEEIAVADWEVVAGCESCGRPILSGDEYFMWEDASTCKECGGAFPGHQPVTAE